MSGFEQKGGVGGAGPFIWLGIAFVVFFVLQALQGCALVPAPTTPVVAPVIRERVIVGDSVVRDGRAALADRIPGAYIYGEVASGPYHSGGNGFVPLIDRVMENIHAKVIVMHDDGRDQTHDSMAHFVRDVEQRMVGGCIVWVTPWSATNREHDAEITRAIEANRGPRSRIAPWGDVVELPGHPLTTDTVHLTPLGASVFAQLIAEAVASC